MTTERIQELPIDLIETLETNKELRNSIASAHRCYTKDFTFKYYKALYYPIDYIVTEQQIEFARQIKEKAIQEALKQNKGIITFINMAMSFKNEIGYIDSYRMRCYFYNNYGKQFFLEVGVSLDKKIMRIDHAIDKDMELEWSTKQINTFRAYKEANKKKNYISLKTSTEEELREINKEIDLCKAEYMKYSNKQPYNNYKGLERNNTNVLEYTNDCLLNLINNEFDCSFKELRIDHYDLSPNHTKLINKP